MTWNLRKPNIRLNVRPVREWDARPQMPRAGLSATDRAAHRARRARECAKIPVNNEIPVVNNVLIEGNT